jgi:hypothetical protein
LLLELSAFESTALFCPVSVSPIGDGESVYLAVEPGADGCGFAIGVIRDPHPVLLLLLLVVETAVVVAAVSEQQRSASV